MDMDGHGDEHETISLISLSLSASDCHCAAAGMFNWRHWNVLHVMLKLCVAVVDLWQSKFTPLQKKEEVNSHARSILPAVSEQSYKKRK